MIPIKNIYYMLAYAFNVLNEAGYKSVAVESFENTGELCAEILCRGVSSLLKQGLGREYIPQTEKLSSLRGKIDYPASVKQNTLFQQQMICTYDEFSVDSYMNRILKTTMLTLIRSNISTKRKSDLRKIVIFFENVKELDPHLIDWHFRFTRNNQTYRMLMGICELVMKGLLQTQSDGSKKLMDFLDEQYMHHLYEHFLLEYYRRERKDCEAEASQIQWVSDNYELLPRMKTDITLSKGNRVFILDAKYYAHTTQKYFSTTSLHSGNMYQIFTYVKNKQLMLPEATVSGMLLYAKTDESFVPENQVYQMSGNKIIVHSLDLNRDFAEIKAELNRLADENL